MTEHPVYIGIGANLGNPVEQVREALRSLNAVPEIILDRHSSLYRSSPVDADGDDYVNAVARVMTSLSPEDLLQELQRIEKDFGRERAYRNAPRTIDLDILLYDDVLLQKNDLFIPHPRMHERAFVLLPLLEIAHDVIIPGKGLAQNFLVHTLHQTISILDT